MAAWIAALVCVMLGTVCVQGAGRPRCKATYVIPMTWVSSLDGSYNAAINIVRPSASPVPWHQIAMHADCHARAILVFLLLCRIAVYLYSAQACMA